VREEGFEESIESFSANTEQLNESSINKQIIGELKKKEE
jgi:hypothetical protein